MTQIQTKDFNCDFPRLHRNHVTADYISREYIKSVVIKANDQRRNCCRQAAMPWEALGQQLSELSLGASGDFQDDQRCLSDTVALLAAGRRLRALTLRAATFSCDLTLLSPLQGLQRLTLTSGLHGEGRPTVGAPMSACCCLAPVHVSFAVPYQRDGAGPAVRA